MASGRDSRGEDQPPALPVKQHRLSSVESDCVLLSPAGLQHENYACDDVFPEPTDCHAAQCPIHQRYDPHRHQVRFFSDGTPPPVPKKRLARALSLPGGRAPPLSPLPPVQRQPQNFDNPLYMLAPIPGTYFHKAPEEFQPAGGSPGPLRCFSQLSFDTPDEHLSYLFGGFDDQRVVSQGIQHRHLLFLRSTAQSVEAGILLQGEAPERDTGSYRPQDFLLCEGSEPKQIGDAVYYSLHSPELPGRTLGLRVHKQPDGAASALTKHPPPHVNVQDVVARFQGSSTLRSDSSILQTQGPSRRFKSDCSAARPRGGGHVSIDLTSALQMGLSVSVERDLPCATLEDFVQDSDRDCLDYDRRVCALLLQILTGSQHLYDTSATAAELRPRGIFLVWPDREREEGGNQLERGASEAKRGHKTSRRREETEWGKKRGNIQASWRRHGAPRVVLTPLASVPHPLTYIKSQVGALIQYCLHSQESPTPLDSGPQLPTSSHRTGLLHLASRLQGEGSGPQVADMVAVLQVLLWGPRVPLLNHGGSGATAVHNWLTVKRALLVTRLAERGLIQDQSALDWEDCMCLQYLSFMDPEAVVSTTIQLGLTLNTESPC